MGTTRLIGIGFVALCALTARPEPAEAQRAFGLQAGVAAGYFTLQGEEFERAEDDFGAEAVIRLTLLERLQLGAGAHVSSHRVDVFDADLDVLVVFAEPRLTFARELPGFAPFVAGRVGYALQSTEVTVDDRGVEADAAGFMIGGVAGVEIPLGRVVAIEPSISYYHLSFDELEIDGTGQTLPQTEGGALGFRIGLNFGI